MPWRRESTCSYIVRSYRPFTSFADDFLEVGCSVITFTQTVHKTVDLTLHVNAVDVVIGWLKSRPGVVYLRRLNIILS